VYVVTKEFKKNIQRFQKWRMFTVGNFGLIVMYMPPPKCMVYISS
jgi:hypothetical protein